jgi:glycerophosphoryl diester phosphodiesterase
VTDRRLNIAHRGASAAAPENTIVAMRRAVRDGADLVEVDVQRSRDGALVLLHDTTLHRTTDARTRFPDRSPWRVGDFTLDELRRLDAGGWWSPGHAGERIPTLDELFDTLRGTGVGVQLELKVPAAHPGVVHDLATFLDEQPVGTDVVVQSFDFAAMKELKTRVPEVPVGLLGRPAHGNLAALATWADQVNPSHRSVDRAYVEKLHDLGLECRVWTVDRTLAMRRAVRLGVDGIITNRPDALGRLLSGSTRFGVPVPG